MSLRRQGEDDMASIVLGVGQQLLRQELAAAFRASFTDPFEVRALQGRGGAGQGGGGAGRCRACVRCGLRCGQVWRSGALHACAVPGILGL